VFGVNGLRALALVSAHPVLDLGTSTGRAHLPKTEEEIVKDQGTEAVQSLALPRVRVRVQVHLLPMTVRQLRVDQRMKAILPH